jgi:hypothetical protein
VSSRNGHEPWKIERAGKILQVANPLVTAQHPIRGGVSPLLQPPSAAFGILPVLCGNQGSVGTLILATRNRVIGYPKIITKVNARFVY